MMETIQDQYILRVRRNSELEALLEATIGKRASVADLETAMGNKNGRWLPNRLPKWFDNVGITRQSDKVGMVYNNPTPNQVQIITPSTNLQFDDYVDDGDMELTSKMRWPDTPPILIPLANFDTPSWYDNMRAMVQCGSHIALEGPPSVGKDTAVEQLAAEIGIPLVTIGGDGGFRTKDLVGAQQIVNGTSFFDIGDYVAAVVNGWWVLLTEVNAADPSALMYINRQLAAPYVVNIGGKSFPVHPNFRLFVTYNHGLAGTKPLPQSFKDRFFSIKVPFFSKAQLRKRLTAMGMSDDPAFEFENAATVEFGIAMWDAYERGQMRYQITTRRLKDAMTLSQSLGVSWKDAMKAAVIDAIDSTVEAKAAQQVLNEVYRIQFNQ